VELKELIEAEEAFVTNSILELMSWPVLKANQSTQANLVS